MNRRSFLSLLPLVTAIWPLSRFISKTNKQSSLNDDLVAYWKLSEPTPNMLSGRTEYVALWKRALSDEEVDLFLLPKIVSDD